MSFLADYDALMTPGADPKEVGPKLAAVVTDWIVQRPLEMFAELRRDRPIFDTPAAVVVSKYRDVLEVIGLDEIFSVQPYGVAMIRNNGGTNFILGMDRGAEYTHDRSVLNLVIRRDDLGRVRQLASEEATRLTEAARAAGKLDITDGFARRIPTVVAGRYFGVPGPTSETLMAWCRAIFTDLFLNFAQDAALQAAGETAGQEFRDYVDSVVTARHTAVSGGQPATDDVVGRLVDMQCAPSAAFTDSRVRDNIIGCITGILDNTNTAVVNIMTVLFDHPTELAGAIEAAKSNDDKTLLAYIYEALRFHPPAPLVVRLCKQDHVLAKGSERETLIPAGKLVFAANGSAIMERGGHRRARRVPASTGPTTTTCTSAGAFTSASASTSRRYSSPKSCRACCCCQESGRPQGRTAKRSTRGLTRPGCTSSSIPRSLGRPRGDGVGRRTASPSLGAEPPLAEIPTSPTESGDTSVRTVVAPGQPGASPASVQRATFTTLGRLGIAGNGPAHGGIGHGAVGRVGAERAVDLELGLLEELVARALMREDGMSLPIEAHVLGLVPRVGELQVDEGSLLALLALAVGDAADGVMLCAGAVLTGDEGAQVDVDPSAQVDLDIALQRDEAMETELRVGFPIDAHDGAAASLDQLVHPEVLEMAPVRAVHKSARVVDRTGCLPPKVAQPGLPPQRRAETGLGRHLLGIRHPVVQPQVEQRHDER